MHETNPARLCAPGSILGIHVPGWRIPAAGMIPIIHPHLHSHGASATISVYPLMISPPFGCRICPVK